MGTQAHQDPRCRSRRPLGLHRGWATPDRGRAQPARDQPHAHEELVTATGTNLPPKPAERMPRHLCPHLPHSVDQLCCGPRRRTHLGSALRYELTKGGSSVHMGS
jgi:hypothetical protein